MATTNKKPKKIVFAKMLTKKNESTGFKNTFVALGRKNPKDPKWDLTVEITVKDVNGKVVAHQTDGFIEYSNPRTKMEELLALGHINEEQAEKMREQASKIPAIVVGELLVKGV